MNIISILSLIGAFALSALVGEANVVLNRMGKPHLFFKQSFLDAICFVATLFNFAIVFINEWPKLVVRFNSSSGATVCVIVGSMAFFHLLSFTTVVAQEARLASRMRKYKREQALYEKRREERYRKEQEAADQQVEQIGDDEIKIIPIRRKKEANS